MGAAGTQCRAAGTHTGAAGTQLGAVGSSELRSGPFRLTLITASWHVILVLLGSIIVCHTNILS